MIMFYTLYSNNVFVVAGSSKQAVEARAYFGGQGPCPLTAPENKNSTTRRTAPVKQNVVFDSYGDITPY